MPERRFRSPPTTSSADSSLWALGTRRTKNPPPPSPACDMNGDDVGVGLMISATAPWYLYMALYGVPSAASVDTRACPILGRQEAFGHDDEEPCRDGERGDGDREHEPLDPERAAQSPAVEIPHLLEAALRRS